MFQAWHKFPGMIFAILRNNFPKFVPKLERRNDRWRWNSEEDGPELAVDTETGPKRF